MLSLADFLLARIAEDEAGARAAGSGSWHIDGPHEVDNRRVVGDDITIYDEGGHDEHQAAHIARHDPARVLAECAAKRAIVELHERKPILTISAHDPFAERPDGYGWASLMGCEICDQGVHDETWGTDLLTAPLAPCDTLKLLALPYADHPDYRAEWAP